MSCSFPEIYHDHFEYAWACLRRLGVPPAAQEDALQELFLVIHRRLPEFAGRSSLKTWIFGVARRVAARHRRTEARRQRRHARLAAVTVAEPLASDDDELARRDARRRLAEFLDRLDDDRRAVFVLHLYEEMPAPEIARTLNLNVNTVYSRIRLVREQLDRTFRDPAELKTATAPEAPPAGAQRRVWAGLLLVLGGGAATAAPGLGLAQSLASTAGTSSFAWALGVGAVALTVVAASPRDLPRPDATAPTLASRGPDSPDSGDTAPSPALQSPGADPSAPSSANRQSPGPAAPPSASDNLQSPDPAAPRPRQTPLGPDPRPASSGRAAASNLERTFLDDLAREAALIADARAALDSGRIDDALASLARHRRAFPRGALQPERLGLRAIALCRAGDLQRGSLEARAFLRQHPDSALAARVRHDCDLTGAAPSPAGASAPARP